MNTVASAVIAALLSWAIFHAHEAIAVLGSAPSGIFGILPGTFNFTLLVTLALTLITRRRVARGEYPRSEQPAQLALAGNAVLRALQLAAILTAALVPVTYVLVWGLIRGGVCSPTWPFPVLLAFFVGYFSVLSLILTPLVVRRALAD